MHVKVIYSKLFLKNADKMTSFLTQQLQAAVEKRNEIISQLSKNLQVALQSRDQVQLEAQQLTDQIQELQQQLQQVKFTRFKKTSFIASQTYSWSSYQ